LSFLLIKNEPVDFVVELIFQMDSYQTILCRYQPMMAAFDKSHHQHHCQDTNFPTTMMMNS